MSYRVALVLGALFWGKTVFATMLPPNDLYLEDSLYRFDSNITEKQFNEIIDRVVSFYSDVVKGHGKTLVVDKKWSDPTVNAYAKQEGKKWKLAMFGGLARRPEVTPDGFALVVCHELGHHLAGYPFVNDFFNSWAANEGQSDYFATQACARRIWQNDQVENARSRATITGTPKTKCDAVWKSETEQNLCYRSAFAAAAITKLLAVLGEEGKEPSFDTPDTNVVEQTDDAHPVAQCRLDTYFAGALCRSNFKVDLIPGKDHADGQDSVAAETIAAQYSCIEYNANPMEGVRPHCWFKSVKPTYY